MESFIEMKGTMIMRERGKCSNSSSPVFCRHAPQGSWSCHRYGNVSESDVFKTVWPGKSGLSDARDFIGRIEALRKEKKGNLEELERESKWELEAVIDWCKEKFGEGEMTDATKVWVQPSKEHREMGEAMITGGEGWREF